MTHEQYIDKLCSVVEDYTKRLNQFKKREKKRLEKDLRDVINEFQTNAEIK